MPGLVYILCAATSLTSAFLLWRAYRASGVRLLFWSTLCFAGMALNNVLMYVDMMVGPNLDLSMPPTIVQLLSVGSLVFGLVWDSN